ncbi:hypothetical protein [Chondromyces crocatus]|uniref:Uncharacterized protein n=1 Tax=Chondromyces crocatus TaxID=52 RepID=A0A0K1EFG1_CHOCO|nr:hypothetical protein [Chondromyces crocatus]AKT39601.1 uncharacterized protein CMC5_037500 [Chondromyces crocatus]
MAIPRNTDRTLRSFAFLLLIVGLSLALACVVSNSGPHPSFRELHLASSRVFNELLASGLTVGVSLLMVSPIAFLVHRYIDVPQRRAEDSRDDTVPTRRAGRGDEHLAIDFGVAAAGGIVGAGVLAGWFPDWFGEEGTLAQALCFVLPLALLAGLRQGHTWGARALFAVAFAVVGLGCLPATEVYLGVRPDPVLTAEFLLPVAIGGLPGGLLVLLVRWWLERGGGAARSAGPSAGP